jgi:integrase
MKNNLQLITDSYLDTRIIKRVAINGVEFDEEFLAGLVANHMNQRGHLKQPTLTTAFEIYLHEKSAANRKRFRDNATRDFNYFLSLFGDLTLQELRHSHATRYRDMQLARGLNPTTVRKHFATLNAMLNLSFKHLDIDRLSPFRGLHIPGEGEVKRYMRTITPELLQAVKSRLLIDRTQYKLLALIQLNTGFRLSEPLFARREDLVLEHEIPHLWIRRNSLSDRKTKSSIRAVPLVGVSLQAAIELEKISVLASSEWLVPRYARENGNTSCSAIINKHLRDLEFRSHMFRHALIDRLKACNDVPTRLAESITGHSSGGSDFNTYGTVGYTLQQKRDVLLRVLV